MIRLVWLVRKLRLELGTDHGTVERVAPVQRHVHMWLCDVPAPGVHDLSALLQQVRAAVGRFDGVLDDVR